jgi:hypothetical protein
VQPGERTVQATRKTLKKESNTTPVNVNIKHRAAATNHNIAPYLRITKTFSAIRCPHLPLRLQTPLLHAPGGTPLLGCHCQQHPCIHLLVERLVWLQQIIYLLSHKSEQKYIKNNKKDRKEYKRYKRESNKYIF